MVGGRRLNRTMAPKQSLVFPVAPVPDENGPPVYEMRHIRIPPIPRESSIVFELILCLHAALFSGLQFVHLYRTVWWLPQSFNSTGINFHMIDENLVIFIAAILGRRIPYLLMKSILPRFTYPALQIAMTVQMLVWTLIASFHLWREKGSYIHIVYLFFPSLLYIYVYGFSIISLWEIEEIDRPGSLDYHICSHEAIQIRDQVENLRNKFNKRLKQVLCLATLTTYYSTFIPWCFSQTYIQYDLWFVSQHLILSWLVVFSLLLSRAFCPDFSDSLHKVACHLGRWTKLRPSHIPSQTWLGDSIFPPGSVVKHQRELYKAEGIRSTASEPGNSTHQKFEVMFSGSSFARLLLGFHVSLITLGLLILLRTSEWYQVISISTLMISALYTFIRLGRDFLIVWKLYQAEEILFRHRQ